VAVNPHEPEENLLYQVLDVSGSPAQAGRKEAPQPLPVLPLQVRYKGLLIAQDQAISSRALS